MDAPKHVYSLARGLLFFHAFSTSAFTVSRMWLGTCASSCWRFHRSLVARISVTHCPMVLATMVYRDSLGIKSIGLASRRWIRVMPLPVTSVRV